MNEDLPLTEIRNQDGVVIASWYGDLIADFAQWQLTPVLECWVDGEFQYRLRYGVPEAL